MRCDGIRLLRFAALLNNLRTRDVARTQILRRPLPRFRAHRQSVQELPKVAVVEFHPVGPCHCWQYYLARYANRVKVMWEEFHAHLRACLEIALWIAQATGLCRPATRRTERAGHPQAMRTAKCLG